MKTASFTIRKSKLKPLILKMIKANKEIPERFRSRVLEITIIDNLIILIVPGIKSELACETQNTAKISLDVLYFYDIIKTSKELLLEFNFADSEMQLGKTKIKVQTTFFETDTILRSIKLPINYSDWHLLQLKNQGFTQEELIFNRLEVAVLDAEYILKQNLKKAKTTLAIYGVTLADIEALVNKRLHL
jgi:hypothetical protein